MSKRPEKKEPSRIGGQEKSVPAYYEGQNAEGSPDHYVTRDEAEQLKGSGDARPIHKGKAVLIKAGSPRNNQPIRRTFSIVVAHQTPRPFQNRFQIPGFPRLEFR